jgi:hypothetical protein
VEINENGKNIMATHDYALFEIPSKPKWRHKNLWSSSKDRVMLSILIPIYNFNAVPLVKELQKQCMECDLEFEIICIDDCSTLHQQEKLFQV